MKQILKVTEAAKHLGIFNLTLRNWTNQGLIKSFRTVGGHRRFKLEDLNIVMNETNNTVTLGGLRTIKALKLEIIRLKDKLAEAETEIGTLKREMEEVGNNGS